MKIKCLTILFAAAVSANAAVTLSFKNWTEANLNGATNALPIVDAAGIPVPTSPATVYASAGYFTTLPNFETATASEILALFNPLDSSGLLGVASRPGMFNGQEYNDASAVNFPAGFSGKAMYIVFGNALNVDGAATKIAVFNAGTTFNTYTAGGAQSITFGISNVYGKVTPIAAQPQTAGTPSAFVNGIQLISAPEAIPETSTSLLGALGALALLRRRRN